MLSLNFTPFPVLTTPRLQLRQLTIADAPALSVIRSNADVNRYIDRADVMTTDDATKFIEKVTTQISNNEMLIWGMVPQGENEIAGTILLWNLQAERWYAEVGYEMLPQWQGKGLMREALHTLLDFGFNTLGFTTIEGFVHHENIRSYTLLQKFGFARNRICMNEKGEETDLIIYLRKSPYV